MLSSDYDVAEESEDEDLPLLMTSHDIIQPLLLELVEKVVSGSKAQDKKVSLLIGRCIGSRCIAYEVTISNMYYRKILLNKHAVMQRLMQHTRVINCVHVFSLRSHSW